MSFSKNDFSVVRVTGRAELDVSMTLDETDLDEDVGVFEEVPLSSFTVVKGYTRGDSGEQSIDPTTGTAGHKEITQDNTPSAFLFKGDYIIGSSGAVEVFSGLVRKVDVGISPSSRAAKRGKFYTKSITYGLASMELLLLSRVASWEFMPQETAMTRLSRWFHVDTSGVSEAHQAQLNAPMPPEDFFGSKSLLEILRDFSAATKLPARLDLALGPNFIEVFDDSVPWTDQPLAPVPGFDNAAEWAVGATYSDQIPVSIDVAENDTRFLGFDTPLPVDVFGFILPVMRLTQNFGDNYNASIELDATGGGEALATYTVTEIVAPGSQPIDKTGVVFGPDNGYNVRQFGAKGNGIVDDTSAIQKAMNRLSVEGGGILTIPAGRFRVTVGIDGYALHIPSNITLRGSGGGGRTWQSPPRNNIDPLYGGYSTSDDAWNLPGEADPACVIFTDSTDGDVIRSINTRNVTIEDICIQGAGKYDAGLLHGIRFHYESEKADTTVPFQINMSRVWIRNMSGDGLIGGTVCVSTFTNVRVSDCFGIGFNWLEGGTSCTFNSCFARACGVGYKFWHWLAGFGATYMTLNSCAADFCLISYWVRGSQSVVFNGCGSEFPRYEVAVPYSGSSYVFGDFTNCSVLQGCYVTGTPASSVTIRMMEGTQQNTIVSFAENGNPETGSYCLATDANTNTAVINMRQTNPNLLANPQTVNFLDDNQGSLMVGRDITTKRDLRADRDAYLNGKVYLGRAGVAETDTFIQSTATSEMRLDAARVEAAGNVVVEREVTFTDISSTAGAVAGGWMDTPRVTHDALVFRVRDGAGAIVKTYFIALQE